MSNQDYYQNQSNNYYPPQGGYEPPSHPPPGHSPSGQSNHNQYPNQQHQYQPYQPYGQGSQNPEQPQYDHQSYQPPYGQHSQNNQSAYPASPQQPVYASQSHGEGRSDPPPPYGYPPQQPAPGDYNDPNGERGVLGALAGGAAGGFGGYKVGGKVTGHSKTTAVLGALAGAYAGHKLQDTVSGKNDEDKKKKEEKKKEKEKKKKDRSRSRSRTRELRGNFSGSCEDIHLDHDSHTLVARCWPIDGDLRSSSIDLNRYLENSWGNFQWVDGNNQTGNFIASARKVRLRDNGKRLEAELGCGNGEWATSSINLDERIGNENGSLRFV